MAGRIIFNEGNRIVSSDILLPLPQSVSLTSTTQTYSSVSQNLSVETRSRGIQRWEMSLDWAPLSRERAMQVYSFFIGQQGSFDTFQVVLPSPINATAGSQVDSDVEGPPMVVDSRTTLSRSIIVANFNRSATVMKAGDFFKFSNHEKLYMVTQDLVTNGAGIGTINFTPPIISSVVTGTDTGTLNVHEGGTEIIHTNSHITCSLKTEQFEIPIDENVHYAMSVDMGERTTATNIVN